MKTFSFQLGHDFTPCQENASARVLTQADFENLGFLLASSELPDEYKFSRMGGWSVSVRSSIIRITFFKLIGTGIAAAFMALNVHTGRYTAFSCALAAAVNFVAAWHYHRIWQIRQQVFNGEAYRPLMSQVGRKSEKEENEKDEAIITFQEVAVDGLRHSDWLCTLGAFVKLEPHRTIAPRTLKKRAVAPICTVLMTLDLGHLREYLTAAANVPPMQVSKEWVASFQSLMIASATVYRFYLSEGRKSSDSDDFLSCRRLFALVTFLASCSIFSLVVFLLLDGLPAQSSEPSIDADIICLKVLTFVWVGYPLVSVAARIGHLNVKAHEYIAFWSFFKDVSYAALDVTSKGGLAIFFVLKAAWMDSEAELALLASNHSTT